MFLLRPFFATAALAAFGMAVAVADPTPAAAPAPASPRQPVPLAESAEKPAKKTAAPAPAALPPLPPGVEELRFDEFFQMPIGPRGLELTERLRSLDGRRVRVLGFMVHEDLSRCNSCVEPPRTKSGRLMPAWMEATVPGRMMLTAAPSAVSHAHYGLADDLPPQTLFVRVPDKFGRLVPYTPGLLLLTGTLSVGNKPEPDGRISIVRLELDLPDASASAATDATTLSPVSPNLGANP